MTDIRYPLIINGVPVVGASAEIDVTTAEQLRMVLLDAGNHGHGMVVVDLTRTRFCDSAGLHVLAGAHRRAVAEGGELRLVIPADGAVVRVLTPTGGDRFIPCFSSLDQALAPAPATALLSLRPRPFPGPSCPRASPAEGRGADG